uniref:Transmembrane emp24 domain-containing protein bai n=1 Tax=Aceria tosichella TaxID=561515 RepID=A0A6G1SPT6_9ACAR
MVRHNISWSYLTILVVFITIQYVDSIRFDLQPNARKCLKEEMRKNLLAVGEYEVSSLAGTTVDFQITDSKGHTALLRTGVDGKGKFAVTSDEDDIYDFCFTYTSSPHAAHQLLPREVNLDVRLGVEAKQYDSATTDKLQKLETDLTKLEDLTNSVIEDFAHLKRRESEMQDTNASTSNRIFWQTLISMLVVLGLAGWQVLYLRQFFRSRKLID